MKSTLLLLLFFALTIVGCVDKKITTNTKIDWDLTYKSILNEKNEHDRWLWNWLGIYTDGVRKDPNLYISPIVDELNSLPTDTILSSFLIEGPAPHAGEHQTTWAIETQDSFLLYAYGEDKLLFKSTMLKKQQYYNLLNLLLEIQYKQPTIHKEFE